MKRRRGYGVTLELDEARGALATLPEVDLDWITVEQLQRLQGGMAQRDVGAVLLYDLVKVRPTTVPRSMQVSAMRNSAGYWA